MESLTIFVKNKEQIELLYEFLQHLDFVTIPPLIHKGEREEESTFSIFQTAGIWSGREIEQTELRNSAWKRK